MEKVRLGKSDLKVTRVGFGGIPIQRLTDAEAVAVIRRCLDLGINWIDTAHGYGSSEARIGQAIAGRREEVILATKSPARDPEGFRQQMALSFERLGVDYVDLFQFHNVSTKEAYEQILAPGGPLDIARKAQAAGRIGHIGVTSHSLELAQILVTSGHFETLMFPYNFVTREPEERLIPLCREHDVGFIAMKPMAGGLLEEASLAFKYLWQQPDLVSVVGIEHAKEMEEIVALEASGATLTAEEWQRIEALREELGTRFCRRCGYCQPCPQGIAISTVMNIKSFEQRFPPERMFGEWGERIMGTAETCIECGECESRCPYQLPIREMIKEYVAWYQARKQAYQSCQC